MCSVILFLVCLPASKESITILLSLYSHSTPILALLMDTSQIFTRFYFLFTVQHLLVHFPRSFNYLLFVSLTSHKLIIDIRI